MNPITIVGIGEALFDLLPDREILGGAPLNVVVHVQQLTAALGGRAFMVSRVGADERGRRLRDELHSRGLDATYIQTDIERPTGTVRVTLEQGEPHYDIVRDVAWDRLAFTPDLPTLAAHCNAICYGTLGQREQMAQESIYRFLEAATGAVKLFDVNLRQHYFSEQILRRSLELATYAKMNQQELLVVCKTLGLGQSENVDELAQRLRKEFCHGALILTSGARGMTLYMENGQLDAPAVRYRAQPHADHIGAGDACSAALLVGMVRDWNPMHTLQLANHMGAFVASVSGATPALPPEIVALASA